jgi:hypothetical protein
MGSQFVHIEAYGRRPSKRKINGRSMQGIAYEAERRPGYCDHVSEPKEPVLLQGCQPSEAVRVAAERAQEAVDADNKKLRIDALVFLAGVASFPTRWETVREDKAEKKRLRAWLGYLIAFLNEHYGDALCYILLHIDEPYPHVHWGCIPKLEPDRTMRISTLHPGRAAYDRARAAGGNNAAGRRAYKAAMKQWQDAIHLAVYSKVGIERIGPRRQRLTPGEHKARKEAAAALSKTLAAEQALKAQWREQLHAKLTAEFSGEIGQWRQHCGELTARLAAANKEISELEARLAELESQLQPPPAASL